MTVANAAPGALETHARLIATGGLRVPIAATFSIEQIRTAVELQHRGVLSLVPLITHGAGFDEAPALFARLDGGEPGLLQSVLEFGTTT